MICETCGATTAHLRYVHIDGKLVGGCDSCANRANPSTISTEKRWMHGIDRPVSPAHIYDIKHRRVQEDGRTVKRNRR